MWVQFINPDGDINDPTNYIQGTAGSQPPWGSKNYRAEKIWRAEGWRNDLPDDWVPPSPPVPKERRIAALNAEFDPQRKQLLEYITTADKVLKDQELVDELCGEFLQLQSDYQARMGAIEDEYA